MTETVQFAIDYEDHQWWFSLQRGEQPLDTLADEPSCLDMWVFHTPDGELVEVRPVVDDEPREITARRLKDWLARWVYEKACRRVLLDGVGWKVWREPGITVMSRSRGERTSLPPPAGLYFMSDLGEICFVQEKLTAIRFVTMPARELVRRLAVAQRDQGWRPGNPTQA